jgi:hypothetical protein
MEIAKPYFRTGVNVSRVLTVCILREAVKLFTCVILERRHASQMHT